MSFQFDIYSADELHSCGKIFVDHAREIVRYSTPEATRATLDWFTRAAPDRVSVSSKSCGGEFLADLVHTTYPPCKLGVKLPWIDWWKTALNSSCEVLLALESEWGSEKQSGVNVREVMWDARKLAAIRARVKVIVFASRNTDNHAELRANLKTLRACADDKSPWLWIDMPWDVERLASQGCCYGVLDG